MNRLFLAFLLCSLSVWAANPGFARERRATHLGNPVTRFAEPLKTPEDLRRVLLSEALREDVANILRQSNYLGDIEDFRTAVAQANLREVQFPKGSLLPAMSTRLKGKPVLLHQVRWAGAKPIEAYEFTFDSKWRRYRVITPKPCSNFWVEEVLPPPLPVLSLDCTAPADAPLPRPLTVCNQVANTGNIAEPLTTIALAIPAHAGVESSTGVATADRLTWTVRDLAPGASQSLCATFVATQPGPLNFAATAVGERATQVASQCATQVHGIPAVLLEVIDLADPVLVGGEVVYHIRVLNQGSLPLGNVRIAASLEDSQAFVSGGGASAVRLVDARVLSEPLPLLNPQQEVTWRLVVKALKEADVRFAVELQADPFSRPIVETEATMQY